MEDQREYDQSAHVSVEIEDEENEEISSDLDFNSPSLETFLHHRIFSRKETFRLAKKWAEEKDESARELLITHNLRLVMKIALGFSRLYAMGSHDLFQEGVIGLMTAIDKFDYRKGYSLTTYASWWIKQRMMRHIIDNQSSIRIPVWLNDERRRVNKARERLTQELGRDPTPDEFAEFCANNGTRDPSDIHQLTAPSLGISLQNLCGVNSEDTLEERIVDRNIIHADCIVLAQEHRQKLIELADQVEAMIMRKIIGKRDNANRNREIFFQRFGLDGQGKKSLDEVGERFGMTRERVRQICDSIIRRFIVNNTSVDRETFENYARNLVIIDEVLARKEAA